MEYYNNENMRRRDRALTPEAAQRVLREGEYGVLSLLENLDGQVGCYGVPLNYVWDCEEYIYIHSATAGHKLDCVELSANVSFCIVLNSQVVASEFTTSFESVIIRGKAERGVSDEQKRRALQLLVEKYSPNFHSQAEECIDDYFSQTEILRVKILSMSGKGK